MSADLSHTHMYRTHTCGELNAKDADKTVKISGWIHRKRDHGHFLFVDVRDHYGITQCVIDQSSPDIAIIDKARLESVVTFIGEVKQRSPETVNKKMETG